MKMIKNNRGMTLVEIILALALLGIVSVGIMGFFTGSFKFQSRSQNTVVAQKIAESIMEELKNSSYSKISQIEDYKDNYNSEDYNLIVEYDKVSTIANDKNALALYKVTVTVVEKRDSSILGTVDSTFSLEQEINDEVKDDEEDDIVVVTLNPNGGECNKATKNVIYGEKYFPLPKPSKVGYTYNYWEYNDSEITSSTKVQTRENHEIKADWTANTYIVYFDTKGGGNCTKNRIDVTYDEEFGVLPELVNKENYCLDGWYYDNEKITENTVVNVTENIILEARYNPNHSYNIINATCTSDGKKVCEGCGYEVKIDKLGHSYISKVAAEYLKSTATTSSAAVYYKSCQNCGIKGTETFTYGLPISYPTYDDDNDEDYGDTNDDTNSEEDNTPTPHRHSYNEVITEATCQVAGVKKCSCGETKNTGTVNHRYKTVRYATCTAKGLEECEWCGVTRETNKIAHDYWATGKCKNCSDTNGANTVPSETLNCCRNPNLDLREGWPSDCEYCGGKNLYHASGFCINCKIDVTRHKCSDCDACIYDVDTL